MPELEPDAHLPSMPPGEQVIEDYRHLHLSLKAHPVSFLRADLDARGIVRHELLPTLMPGRRVTIGGLVLVRQRPGNGNAIFMTLEDETGDRQHDRVAAKVRAVSPGRHGRAADQRHRRSAERKGRHPHRRRPFRGSDVPARAAVGARRPHRSDVPPDVIKRPLISRQRHPRSGDALVTMLKEDKPALEEIAAAQHTAQVMPKGRNFH